ncbi:hypothetical protein MSG28_000025 [Choristoneura fumiferana]|uniref:Uncharacterized protein n=1 Tax=Choristoneura fumiferana TaxID=7141 RepID=A0ACC0JZM3_CHOFU|nr:hypothetical protein MSG28_000025 [Choristoneura fumiferana]
MAKRSNPYIEDFVPQSKIHVGVKQFNNNEDRLQKVYEKTLELLFRGAKKLPGKSVTEQAEKTNDNKKDGLKQLFLGKDGHLMQSGVLEEHSTHKCACRVPSDDRCGYCEKTLCGSCRHPFKKAES